MEAYCALCDEAYDPEHPEDHARHLHPEPQGGRLRERNGKISLSA